MANSRSRRKHAVYRPKPGAELTIEQLQAIAKYLGYQLVQTSPPLVRFCLYDCRNGNVKAHDNSALDHLRRLYLDRDLASAPELKATEGEL
jgi:hypothetical protein